MRVLRSGGKVLLVVGVAMDIHEVATAPPEQRTRTAVGVGGGFLGGLALGAAAGLVCGPGAPVCSTVLGIGFGILGAFGGRAAAEGLYDSLTETPTSGGQPAENYDCVQEGFC
jgi:hypothetical protein